MSNLKSLRRLRSLRLLPLLPIMTWSSASALPPSWWASGSPPVIDPVAPASSRGVANVGQAKWIAKNALEALRGAAPFIANQIDIDLVGAGKPIASWDAPVTEADRNGQHSVLLLGQLKAIAAPFYLRLQSSVPAWLSNERVTNGMPDTGTFYPWTSTNLDDINLAPATIGQLKAVFSLRFESLAAAVSADGDGDGLADGWERFYFSDLSQTGTSDFDGDGLSNLWEFANNTNPATLAANRDSDGDGLPDDWERRWFSNLAQTGAGDSEGDGLTHAQEFSKLSNPTNPDTDGDGMGDGFEDYYGLALNSAANDPTGRLGPDDDKDQDGRTNKEEWIAGTIPINSSEEPAYTSNPITLHWFGVAGKFYTIQWTSNLVTWQESGLDLPGQNLEIPLLVQTVVGGTPPPTFFCRIKILNVEDASSRKLDVFNLTNF